jgi:hypothetical protein
MTGAANTPFVEKHTTDITANGDGMVDATTLNTAAQNACGDNKGIFSVAVMHSIVATHLENLHLLEYLKYTDASGVQRNLNLATWNGRTVLIDDGVPVSSDTSPKYTTFLLGEGAFEFCDCGAKLPYEMSRDPKTNGGEETLYTRQRKLFAPAGISFTKSAMASLSPTSTELETAANWALVNDGSVNTIDHKAIPIARIISLG